MVTVTTDLRLCLYLSANLLMTPPHFELPRKGREHEMRDDWKSFCAACALPFVHMQPLCVLENSKPSHAKRSQLLCPVMLHQSFMSKQSLPTPGAHHPCILHVFTPSYNHQAPSNIQQLLFATNEQRTKTFYRVPRETMAVMRNLLASAPRNAY